MAIEKENSFIKSLLRAAAFPHPTTQIRYLETHISWVVLTGTYAYKIKKPVALGFLDFSTLELRKHYCAEELRLNRRWAPVGPDRPVPIGRWLRLPRSTAGFVCALTRAARAHPRPDHPCLQRPVCRRRRFALVARKSDARCPYAMFRRSALATVRC